MKKILLLLMTISINAYGTSWSADHIYFVKIHYDAHAYSKEVSDVTAHMGVEGLSQPEWMGGAYIWQDVQDVNLQKEGGQFQGIAELRASSGKFGPIVKNPVIQYHVKFADGSEAISDVFPIHILERRQGDSYPDEEEILELENIFYSSPISETLGVTISFVRIH